MKLSSQRFGSNPFPTDYDVVRQTTLNKSDLIANNNKFYVIESHVSKDGKKFRLYSRYGRVGKHGVEEERIPPQDIHSLDDAFDSLLREKTAAKKGYKEVALAKSSMGSDVGNSKLLSDDVKKVVVQDAKTDDETIKINPSVKRLTKILYEEAGQAVKNSLSGTVNSSTENPLGTLTVTQINTGRQILQDIQTKLDKDPGLIATIDRKLVELSNDFYTTIPQDINVRKQGLDALCLNTADKLDKQEEFLQLLEDVELMTAGFATDDIGKKYQEIGCEFKPIESSDKIFKRIDKYVKGTVSGHHKHMYGGIKIQNIWEMSVKGQEKKNTDLMEKTGNVQELFHGSRNANILGISKHGLLLRPKGVYITGSMFGNGLYFANQSSKSMQYSTARFGGGRGSFSSSFLFLADVALGKVKKYTDAQSHLQSAPKGYHSVQGEKGRHLLHDEFIIYDVKQHILKYLVEFEQ